MATRNPDLSFTSVDRETEVRNLRELSSNTRNCEAHRSKHSELELKLPKDSPSLAVKGGHLTCCSGGGDLNWAGHKGKGKELVYQKEIGRTPEKAGTCMGTAE